MTVFIIFKKKINGTNAKTSSVPRHDCGATFASVGTLLILFRFYFGCAGYICSSFSMFYSALISWPRFIRSLPVGTCTKKDSRNNPFLAHAVGHTFYRVCLRMKFHHLFTSRNNTSCYSLPSYLALSVGHTVWTVSSLWPPILSSTFNVYTAT